MKEKNFENIEKKRILDYKELLVWKEAVTLVEMVYSITKLIAKEETFGLISQIQRAAVSIPANIAEGWGRMSVKELKRFCLIAKGSALELETHLIITEKLILVQKEKLVPIFNQLQKVIRLLSGLIRSQNRN